MTDSPIAVTAAGGVIVRGSGDAARIAIVHRPSYNDWSLPKGKSDDDETPVQTARREVREETGLVCRVLAAVGRQEYLVAEGLKSVDYFLMRPVRSGAFLAGDEVDETRWVDWDEAASLLTYDLDRTLLDQIDRSRATAGGVLHLIRHGAAGNRSAWEGDDHDRPLTDKGRRQAESLAEELGEVGVTRVLSSPYLRCIQTVEPLATRLGVPVDTHPALAEGPDRKAIAELLAEVEGSTVVMSSHGDVIPAALERLQRSGVRFVSPYECRKGSTWSVVHDGTEFIEASYEAPPRV